MQYEKMFRTQSVWKSIISLAVPSVVIILVMIIYNMTDMFFVGQLGDTAQVAAVSVVGPLFSVSAAVATMLGVGGSAIIARVLGEGKEERAKDYASLCFWGALLLGIIIATLILLAREWILPFLGTTSEVLPFARTYMSICAVGVPFMLLSTTLASIIRAEGAVKEGMIGNMTATVVNMLLDPLFILVLGMGVAGAAVATVLGNLVGTLYYVLYMRRKAQVLNMNFGRAKRHVKKIGNVFALGMPNALGSILSGFASTFANQLLAGYGTGAIAAMAAAGKTTMLISMILMGTCMGIQPLLAYNYGAKDVRRLKEIIRKMLILTTSIGVLTGGLCFFGRHTIIAMFIKDAAVAQLGEKMVIYLVIASPIVGIYYLGSNFLQASGNVIGANVVSVLRQGVLLILFLYIMEAMAGVVGVAAAHTLADVSSVLVAALLLWKGYQKLKK